MQRMFTLELLRVHLFLWFFFFLPFFLFYKKVKFTFHLVQRYSRIVLNQTNLPFLLTSVIVSGKAVWPSAEGTLFYWVLQ